jgi:hypothetical protein
MELSERHPRVEHGPRRPVLQPGNQLERLLSLPLAELRVGNDADREPRAEPGGRSRMLGVVVRRPPRDRATGSALHFMS